MTEVLGAPGPVERFSSFPIRGRDRSVAEATCRSELEVICDMARAIGTDVRYPMGKPERRPADPFPLELPAASHSSFQVAHSQPARPMRVDGVENMGQSTAFRKRTAAKATRARQARFPTCDPFRLTNSGPFDKRECVGPFGDFSEATLVAKREC